MRSCCWLDKGKFFLCHHLIIGSHTLLPWGDVGAKLCPKGRLRNCSALYHTCVPNFPSRCNILSCRIDTFGGECIWKLFHLGTHKVPKWPSPISFPNQYYPWHPFNCLNLALTILLSTLLTLPLGHLCEGNHRILEIRHLLGYCEQYFIYTKNVL